MQMHMQKFLKIAEQQVQWVALGVGALYLLFMAWSYGYQSDIAVTLGPQKDVQPGDVDSAIVKGPITQLDKQMEITDPIVITPPNVVAEWTKQAGDQADLHLLPVVVSGGDPTRQFGSVGPSDATVGEGLLAKIGKLPQLPAAIPVAIASYRTLAQYADPTFDAAANPGVAVPMISRDLDAVSVEFKVDMKQLSKAFTDAFQAPPPAPPVPPKMFQTMYLQVTLFRQELDSSGKNWTPPVAKVIPPLAINVSPAPYPSSDTPSELEGRTYQFWAQSNQELILRPPFYPTAPGADPWYMPDNPPAAAADAGGAWQRRRTAAFTRSRCSLPPPSWRGRFADGAVVRSGLPRRLAHSLASIHPAAAGRQWRAGQFLQSNRQEH